ncbi:hypothetical protein MT378_19080 [Psychrobacter sp. 16-Bac2893]
MVSLPLLATKLGVKSILVKDESKRFGLNVYKALGSSYALGCLLAKHLNIDIVDIDIATVDSKLGKPLVFATAIVGNHGINVGWAALKTKTALLIITQITPLDYNLDYLIQKSLQTN